MRQTPWWDREVFELSVPLASNRLILVEEKGPQVDQNGLERRRPFPRSDPSPDAGESISGVSTRSAAAQAATPKTNTAHPADAVTLSCDTW